MDTADIDKELVSKIRARFLEQLNDECKFDARDIERVKSSDVFIWRFVEDRKSDQEATIVATIKSLVICLTWRKEHGVNDLKPSDFPAEVIGSGRVRVG